MAHENITVVGRYPEVCYNTACPAVLELEVDGEAATGVIGKDTGLEGGRPTVSVPRAVLEGYLAQIGPDDGLPTQLVQVVSAYPHELPEQITFVGHQALVGVDGVAPDEAAIQL